MKLLIVQRARRLMGWLGALAMLAICVVPFVLLMLAANHAMSVTVVGSKDSGLRLDYGFFLSQTPGAPATALLAPLVGYRRRVALWFILPPVNIYYAWVVGFRAGDLGTRLAPHATPSSESPGRRDGDLIREGLRREHAR